MQIQNSKTFLCSRISMHHTRLVQVFRLWSLEKRIDWKTAKLILPPRLRRTQKMDIRYSPTRQNTVILYTQNYFQICRRKHIYIIILGYDYCPLLYPMDGLQGVRYIPMRYDIYCMAFGIPNISKFSWLVGASSRIWQIHYES